MQRFITEHVNSIICYLTGISEGHQIIEFTQEKDLEEDDLLRRMMVSTLGTMCPLSTHIRTMVEESQLIKTYRHVCTTKSLILKNVRIERSPKSCVQLLTGLRKYQCAFKSCQKEAGVWMPWHPGRGVQHSPEESYDGSIECVGDGPSSSPQELVAEFAASQQRTLEKYVVVVCSFKCYCRVKAYLYGLGGNMWRHIYVVRGTKQVPEQLKRALEKVMHQRDLEDRRSGNRMCWSAEPGEYDRLIDDLDCEQHTFCT